MSNPIQAALAAALEQGLTDNTEIAMFIRHNVPGAQTTASSVSSMKSRLKSAIALGGALPAGGAAAAMTWQSLPEAPEEDTETLEEAKARINVRYNALGRMSRMLVKGEMPSLIVSGPPGLGKSHTIREALDEMGDEMVDWNDASQMGIGDGEEDEVSVEEISQRVYDVISGSITAVGLYQALWNTRKGGVLVLDDIDEVFRDEVCLNLLKAALDSGKRRTLSWRKEAQWLEDYGIAKTFDYEGHVIFLTNIDFEREIEKNNKMAEHFKALIDRSMYLCLTLRTKRDFMIRIRQVAEGAEGMLANAFKLTEEQADEVLDFVTEHQTRFYNLSLRLVGQVAILMRSNPLGWQEDVEATKMRTR